MTATQHQWRRGTAAQMATFTGASGEVTVDTTNNRVVVHDGMTAGGWPAAGGALVNNQVYISAAGNDANNGLSAGAPKLTWAAVMALVAQLRGNVTVNIANGTYDITAAIGVFGEHSISGRHLVNFTGNVGSPGSVVIRANTNNQQIFDIEDYGCAVISGATLAANTGVTGVTGIFARQHSIADFSSGVFAALPGGTHVLSTNFASINLDGGYSITGGANAHIQINEGGSVHLPGGSTVTITGTPTFSVFALVDSGGQLLSEASVTYSGSITGPAFTYDPTAIVSIGSTTFPGSTGTDQRPGAVTGAIKADGSQNFSHASAADLAGGAAATVKVQKFTSGGTYTPSTGLLYCIIECVGGGGGGGAAAGTAGSIFDGGGG